LQPADGTPSGFGVAYAAPKVAEYGNLGLQFTTTAWLRTESRTSNISTGDFDSGKQSLREQAARGTSGERGFVGSQASFVCACVSLHRDRQSFVRGYVNLDRSKTSLVHRFVNLQSGQQGFVRGFVNLHRVKTSFIRGYVNLHRSKTSFIRGYVNLHRSKTSFVCGYVSLQSAKTNFISGLAGKLPIRERLAHLRD
jgi:hypothetical protein